MMLSKGCDPSGGSERSQSAD